MKQNAFVLLFTIASLTAIGQKTQFESNTGEFAILLQKLEKDMYRDEELVFQKTLGGKKRDVFVPWIRDHVHVMKAMKFLHKDMTSFLEFYLENQTEEGIYYDYFYPLGFGGAGSRKKIFDRRYWKEFPEDSIEMHRLPVEADLEYLLVEGVYTAWQSNGDIAFVKKWLPTLVRGLKYSMTDPLRWSTKHQLVKRGYTLDTWDFMQLPSSREEYTRKGGNVQKGIFDIDEDTPMGIMHGDNSGMYSACLKLAQLYALVGDQKSSNEWNDKASHFRDRTNSICWNGKFYAHFIEDDPQPPYLKMDQKNTLSLSNPYDINRGLPTGEMSQSIIKTYRDLKESNQKNSFAEWYGIYPPVYPHFADYLPGSYMNGGVNTIVAGELAKAAFRHGYEKYGVDILNRINELMIKHNDHLPVAYTPTGKVDEGIPDNWGQAAVYSAMIEGLAGVVDLGAQFEVLEFSPRWLAADKKESTVTIAYGPTGKAVTYLWSHNSSQKMISIIIDGPMRKSIVRTLLPQGAAPVSALLNGKPVPFKVEKILQSTYVVVDEVPGPHIEVSVGYR